MLLQWRKHIIQLGSRLLSQRHVNKPFPTIKLQPTQAMLRGIESGFHFHVRRAQQLTRAVVAPGMVAAGKAFC
jgi:hypothetical protein